MYQPNGHPSFSKSEEILREAVSHHDEAYPYLKRMQKHKDLLVAALLEECKPFTKEQLLPIFTKMYWTRHFLGSSVAFAWRDRFHEKFYPESTTYEFICGFCHNSSITTCDDWDHRKYLEAHKVCRDCTTKAFEENDKIQSLKTMPYKEYLLTEHWQKLRLLLLRRADFKCQICYGSHKLEVHHRTYARRGCEEIADLTVLCHQCHDKFHADMQLEED